MVSEPRRRERESESESEIEAGQVFVYSLDRFSIIVSKIDKVGLVEQEARLALAGELEQEASTHFTDRNQLMLS